MQVDVGKQWAYNLPLTGPRLALQQPSIIDYPNVDPLPYQSQNTRVAYPTLDHLHEMLPDNRIEIGNNIQFKNILGRRPTYHSANFVQRVLCTSSRTASMGAVEKVLLEDRVEQ